MTITRKQIQRMRSDARMRIEADLEELILARYGEEPDGPQYTDQDLHKQIGKPVNRYNLEHADPRLAADPAPQARSSSTAPAAKKHKEEDKYPINHITCTVIGGGETREIPAVFSGNLWR